MNFRYVKRMLNCIRNLDRDLWIGVGDIIFSGILLLWLIPNYVRLRTAGEGGLSPQFFPYLITAGLLLVGFLLTFFNLKNACSFNKGYHDIREKLSIFNIIIILILFIYFSFIKLFGMLASSIVFLSILIHMFGYKKWFINVLISIVIVILLFFFFEKIAKVSFPRGIILKI